MFGVVVLLLIAGAIIFVYSLVFWIQPVEILGVIERITPKIRYRVRTNLPLVALSFDDGPDPQFTPHVLEILKRHGAKATFFLIGERALRFPELVASIKGAGHEVANHCYSGGTTLIHSDSQFLGSIEKTQQAIGLFKEPKLFRPPGGVAWPWQLRRAREHGASAGVVHQMAHCEKSVAGNNCDPSRRNF